MVGDSYRLCATIATAIQSRASTIARRAVPPITSERVRVKTISLGSARIHQVERLMHPMEGSAK